LSEPSLPSRYEGFDSALKNTSFQEDTVLAFEAFDSDISTKPDHLPLIAAAGVLLFEANHITQLYLHNHFVTAQILKS